MLIVIAIVVSLVVFGVGAWVGTFLPHYLGLKKETKPVESIVNTDAKIETAKDIVKGMRQERGDLDARIREKKDLVVDDVRGLGDDDVAGRWNELLGKYQRDKADAEGARSE